MTDAGLSTEPSPNMTLAEQRVAGCPIKPCRGADDNETMLRSIRSDRLLCMYCATRTPTGYMGREEARKHEDKFFKATQNDYVIQFAVVAVGTAVACAISALIGFIIFIFLIGAGAGGVVGTLARRLSGNRLGRYSAQIGIAGVVVGTLAGPVVYALVRTGKFIPQAAVNLNTIICGAIMGAAIYSLMRGRI